MTGGIRALRAACALAACLGASGAGCGGGTTSIRVFTTNWTDDGGKSMAQVWKKLEGRHPPPGANVVVAVAGSADKLIGEPLEGGEKWAYAHAIDARPVVAGSVVVATGGTELFALDASTGKHLWTRPTGGLKLHGAGDDGNVTVVTLARGSGLGSVLLAVARDGSVLRQIETDKELGAPAVLGGYAFVPWNGVYVSAIDINSGDEAARLVVREQTSRAWTLGGELYFGEVGIFRFDSKISLADKNGASYVSIPVRELPGSPKLMPPGTEHPGAASDAEDRVRIFARTAPGDSSPLAIDSDRYFATYFKLAMGFDAKGGGLAWVHTHDSDFIGGAAGPGDVVLCDEKGHATLLDAKTGGVAGDIDLGEQVLSCVVQVDSLREKGDPAPTPPLAEQLSQALVNRDAELATAKRLLLRELATLPDETATKTLIELASSERTSPMVLPDARKALADRRTGAQFMLAALAHHYDFLKDELRSPPVGPMAHALGAMGEKRAAPLLAAQLLDPANSDEDVKEAAQALVRLASPAEAPRLAQFFGMYRSAATDEDVEVAVVSVAQALAKVGSAADKKRILDAMSDPMTLPNVSERLKALVVVAPAAATATDAGTTP
jgi:outer membrane protein assembly factor BamB